MSEEAIKDFNKPTWKPRFQSEYSMGELDFQRFNRTLCTIDSLSALMNSTYLPSLQLMQQLFSELINLYDDFRPLISYANITKSIDEVQERGITLKRIWEQNVASGMPVNRKNVFEFVDLCRGLKTKLYYLKQTIGLGIVVRRNMDTAEKIRKGVHGDRDFDQLPEA